MQSAPQESRGPFQDTLLALSWFFAITHCAAATVQLFLRAPGTAGHWYFIKRLPFGFLLFLVYAFYCPRDRHPEWTLAFLNWSFWLAIAHFALSLVRKRVGGLLHSEYVGASWLEWIPRVTPGCAKFIGEFAILVALGVTLWLHGSHAVGGWLMLCAGLNPLSLLLLYERDMRRRDQMHDSYLEQQAWSNRVREFTNEGR